LFLVALVTGDLIVTALKSKLFTLSFGEEDWFGYSSDGGFVGESFHGLG
jgi:hypothetical protein